MKLRIILLGPLLLVSGWTQAASELYLDDILDGYSDCSYTVGGWSGKWIDVIITVTAKYKAVRDNKSVQRAVLVNYYNGYGNPAAVDERTVVTMNGNKGDFWLQGSEAKYSGGSKWDNDKAFDAVFKIIVPGHYLDSWPALAVRPVNRVLENYTFKNYGDKTGLAYITSSDKGGKCNIILDSALPPPAKITKVTMSAPDWDLGELPRGQETTLTLPATKDQLCFTYEASKPIANQKYLINATSANGVPGNGHYLLKNLEDSSQTVPYTLTLANTTDTVLLPNAVNQIFSLDKVGKTCFTPTFKAQPDKAVKGGAYSDILTFTVVTKP